tara:strand:+ start:4662 stop:5033 length:372 start_codon:yes stop_codon:yes gene_type:complete
MKLKITSDRLIEMGVNIVDFVKNGPLDAITSAASDIGESKGWGAEGCGALATEFMEELGFYAARETCEEWSDLEEGDEVLLDGVDVMKFDTRELEREQLLVRQKDLIEELYSVHEHLICLEGE